jgi:hypothetical protein
MPSVSGRRSSRCREGPANPPVSPGGMPFKPGMPVHRVVGVLQEGNVVKTEDTRGIERRSNLH